MSSADLRVHRDTVTRTAKSTRIRPGDILVSTVNDLGPGKALETGPDDSIVLEYFDTPGQDPADRARHALPRRSLKRYGLSNETRVFWQDDGRWRSGRVLYTTPERDIYVKGYEWEGFVDEADIHVRWHRPHTDPVGFSSAELLESPLLAERRRPFLQELLLQRSAARGMGSLSSSNIELHQHQLEIAQRVLDDPIQRYLLADEVGLGKTIEAGLVIRQLLLDHDKFSVQLILPPFLVGQWRRELEGKFLVHEFSGATLRYSRDDEPERWERADLLVVDEAHNLARLHTHEAQQLARRYETLKHVAHNSPRLLLLSATPVLHNERIFLAMLHLLDPDVYGADEVEELRERVAARARLGRVLLGLRPLAPVVLLRRRFQEVAALFPADSELSALAARGLEALSQEHTDAVARAIQAIRLHVTEVYRLHRRMLRTRRTDALTSTYRVTGRRPPDIVTLDWPLYEEVHTLLDAWRQELLADVEGDEDAELRAATVLADAVALATDPVALGEWARARGDVGVSDHEAEALRRLERGMASIDRLEQVAQPLADELSFRLVGQERAAVFCASTDLARETADALTEFLGEGVVRTHLSDEAPAEVELALRAFESETDPAQILVCDRSAEEGRNLQFADVLIHVGLPSDPNRLEQRIGRFDRWASHEMPWRSLLVEPSEGVDTVVTAWTQVLLRGFGVFQRSIASLQQAVELSAGDAWRLLLRDGVDGVEEAVERVTQLLTDEVEQVREQDALDAVEAVEDAGSAYRTLSKAEERADRFAEISDDLFASAGAQGNLRFARLGDPVRGLGTYQIRPKHGPQRSLPPLLPTWRLVRDFLHLEGHTGTFRRDVSISRAGVHLYRYGDAFMGAIADFLWNDDRGRAWGMWRHIPGWSEAERPWFRFDYHVEADTDHVTEVLRRHRPDVELTSTARRGDAFLPPLIVTRWVAEDGNVPTPTVREVLERPYNRVPDHEGGRDYNLNRGRIEWLFDLIPRLEWPELWRTLENQTAKEIQTQQEVVDAIHAARTDASQRLEVRIRQMDLRAARIQGAERDRVLSDIELERELKEALLAGVEAPALRLDSVGVVVLSNEAPEAAADG